MINSAVVNAYVWVHLALLLIVIAYALCARAILPAWSERGRHRVARHPVGTLLIGLALSAPWVALSLIMMNLGTGGPVALVGALIGITWLGVALLGLGGFATHVGGGEAEASNRWTTTARGAAALALTWMLPFIGWFIVLPLTLAWSVGCLVAGGRRAAAESA